MNTQFVRKALLAFMLALSLLCGAGVVAEQTGINLVSAAYACGAGNGGGC
jgi:hypothetical protein